MIPNAADPRAHLFQDLSLPCGLVLKNRIAKSAMSDSLGDGRGNPTEAQCRLYERWAQGGVALSIIGEVQMTGRFAEKPGNLVLNSQSDRAMFDALAHRGSANNTQLWPQLGHAGAMAHPPISVPKGPSALDTDGLTCSALTLDEVQALPAEFAQTAHLAQNTGFGGVQIHAAHGFLLSQFLSPLFNKRTDEYGGSITGRMRLLLEVIERVRSAVGPHFPVAVKLNATDQLEGGLTQDEALLVVEALDATSVDLIDISGGTYFPGAKSASDRAGSGPYFVEFARRARSKTTTPLMVTGGFKTYQQVSEALSTGALDVVGLARALVVEPDLPNKWQENGLVDPSFPRFASMPEGGVTAWYTMRLTEIGEDRSTEAPPDADRAMIAYNQRDRDRVARWRTHFGL